MCTSDFVYLNAIETFEIDQTILQRTRDLLAKQGRNGLEAMVLWSGYRHSGDTFRISEALFPGQKATPLDIYVPPPESEAVFDRIAKRRLVLAGQVHTHPGEAFHSYTDEAFPLATQIGSLSIVVPNFAADPLTNLHSCAVYRLGEDGWQGPIRGSALSELIQVVNSWDLEGGTE